VNVILVDNLIEECMKSAEVLNIKQERSMVIHYSAAEKLINEGDMIKQFSSILKNQ